MWQIVPPTYKSYSCVILFDTQMISLKETKELLAKPDMTDDEAKKIRDDCYALAELFLEFLLKADTGQGIVTKKK